MIIIERHLLSDYITIKSYESHIVPGKQVSYHEFNCPICGTLQDDPPHGKRVECKECGLGMTAWGNSLELEL
jgi:hypothetical protein